MTVLGSSAAYASPIVVHDEPSDARWDTYVARHPAASAYHFSAWARVISRTFGHETRYLSAESSRGIVGVLPLVIFRSRLFGRFAVSMPFLNYGGIIADAPEAETALLAAAAAEARRSALSYVELRHTRQLFPHLPYKRHKVAMVLSLEATADRQWQRLDRKVRNQVRKAEKSGLGVVQGGGELLPSFYSVFARNMRDLGTPVYALGFFQEILSAFPENTRIFCVHHDGRPIAASVAYWHGDTYEVPWASTVRDFNALCPNTLMYWELLRSAVGRGFRRFDFGRSTEGEGTYQFKRQWGAEPQPLIWEYWMADGRPLPDLSPRNRKFELAISAWRRLPVRLTLLFGPPIVRNIP